MNTVSRDSLAAALCSVFKEDLEVSRLDSGEWRVLVPLLDEHNDPLEFLVSSGPEEGLLVTDGGYLHREVVLKTAQERPDAAVWENVAVAANRLDLKWGGGYLWSPVSGVTGIGHAMLSMVDTITLALQASGQYVPPVQVQFWEEVMMFFQDERVEFKRNERVTGISQVAHRVDFTLRNGHLHTVQAIASEASMRRSLNVFYDIVEALPDVVPISFVDDSKTGYSNETFEQLSYKSDVYLWKEKARFLDYWARTA